MESVPSCHHYKSTENTPVDNKAFMTAVYKEVYNGYVDCLIEHGLTSPPTQYRLYGRRV